MTDPKSEINQLFSLPRLAVSVCHLVEGCWHDTDTVEI